MPGKINSPTIQRPDVPLTASSSEGIPVESASMNTRSLPFDPVRTNVPRPDVGLAYNGQSGSPVESNIRQSDLRLDVPRPDVKMDKPTTFEIPETVKDIIPSNIPLDKVVVDLIKKTTEIIGPIPVQNNIVTVTQKSLEDASRPNGKYSIVIDSNTNTAVLKTPDSVTVKEFAIGTGDTTGLRTGKKYFTPTGTFSIREKNEEKGEYAPFWMEFKPGVLSDYGIHGPYEDEKKVVKEGKFINEGYVSQGCVRFKAEDLKEVAKYLKLGSQVTVLPYKMKPSQSFNPAMQ